MSPVANPTGTARSEWFESWFDSPHYQGLYRYRDDTEASGLVDALVARLKPSRGARVLDLGCGTGRHSKYLASKGLWVTERLVALLGRCAERIDDALVGRRRFPLQSGAIHGCGSGDARHRPFVCGPIEYEQIRVLDGINEILRRSSWREQADWIPDPPVLRRELQDVLLAIGVDDIASKAARRNERTVRCGVTGPLEEFAGAKRPGEIQRLHVGKLFVGEGRFALEVCPQSVKLRHRSDRLYDCG
jgi:SAM-dependent methyltransferase